jgi:F0F1-type ATP synthase assembly protein I
MDPVAGRSLLIGGLAFPAAAGVVRLAECSGTVAPLPHAVVANGFYRAEAGKFLLSCAGFAAVFRRVHGRCTQPRFLAPTSSCMS